MSLVYFFLIIICLWLLTSVLELSRDSLKYTHISLKLRYEAFQIYLLKPNANSDIPNYKFYTQIVSELLKLRKRYGTDVREAFRELKKASQNDYKENCNIQNEISGFYFQYVFVSIFTWVFILNFESTLELETSLFKTLGLLVWQIFGAMASWRIIVILRRSSFGLFSSYFKSLYILKSLLLSSRPVSEALDKAKFLEIEASSKLSFVQGVIETILNNIKQYGIFHQSDIDGVILDLWGLYENEIHKFKKRLIGIKLFFIGFFIFPGFLWSLYQSLTQVMIWS
jgi:hypothetical protein